MSEIAHHNDQNPTDPTTILLTLLAGIALTKTLTTQEVHTLAALLPALLAVLPLARR